MHRLVAAIAFAAGLLHCIVDATRGATECTSITTCYMGGVTSMPCVIGQEDCPPCVQEDTTYCYVKVQGECPFGTDCSAQFSSSSNSSSSSSASASDSSATSTADSSSIASKSSTSSPLGSTGGLTPGAVDSSSSQEGNGQSNTLLVFAIISVAVGVVAVGMILVALVRHARTANEMVVDLPSPESTTGTASIASFSTTGQPVDLLPSRSALSTMLKSSSLSRDSSCSQESLLLPSIPDEESSSCAAHGVTATTRSGHERSALQQQER